MVGCEREREREGGSIHMNIRRHQDPICPTGTRGPVAGRGRGHACDSKGTRASGAIDHIDIGRLIPSRSGRRPSKGTRRISSPSHPSLATSPRFCFFMPPLLFLVLLQICSFGGALDSLTAFADDADMMPARSRSLTIQSNPAHAPA